MIYVGTSGYSYDDWVGPYYPPGTPKSRFLEYYARDFNCCEINYTFYTMPSARTLAAMGNKTPAGFKFALKAHRTMTHEREAATAEAFESFRQALEPLIEQGKFGCVLAQFPNSFKPTHQARLHLELLRRQLADVPVVLEFRTSEWARESVLEFMRAEGLGFCCVDEPRFRSLMPPMVAATSEIGYIRFHGRNYQKWWRHAEAWERYDYLYCRRELAEWLPKVQQLAEQGAKDIYIFFNNHYQAQAVQNARLFREMLQEADLA